MKKHAWLYKYTMDVPRISISWEPLLLLINDKKDLKDKLDEISECVSIDLATIIHT